MKRKKYSPEFKREAIELVRRTGASCRQVTLKVDVPPSLITKGVLIRGTAFPFWQ